MNEDSLLRDSPLGRLTKFVGRYGHLATREDDYKALEDLSALYIGLKRIAIGIEGRRKTGIWWNEQYSESMPNMSKTDWQLAQQLLGWTEEDAHAYVREGME